MEFVHTQKGAPPSMSQTLFTFRHAFRQFANLLFSINLISHLSCFTIFTCCSMFRSFFFSSIGTQIVCPFYVTVCTMCRTILANFNNLDNSQFSPWTSASCFSTAIQPDRTKRKSIDRNWTTAERKGQQKSCVCPLKLEPMISCWQVETLCWKVRVIVTWWHFLFFSFLFCLIPFIRHS